jgi:hypothetical protein
LKEKRRVLLESQAAPKGEDRTARILVKSPRLKRMVEGRINAT